MIAQNEKFFFLSQLLLAHDIALASDATEQLQCLVIETVEVGE